MKKPTKYSISIKKRIFLSFFTLVLLFVINGAITIFTLIKNNELSKNIFTVIEPSHESLKSFQDVLLKSKMYSTNWVFLRFNKEDKEELIKLQKTTYPQLKTTLKKLIQKWDCKGRADSVEMIFGSFEKLMTDQKKIMLSLKNFEDYDDPSLKLGAEIILEDEILPQTSTLFSVLEKIVASEQQYKLEKKAALEKTSDQLTTLVTMFSLCMVAIGIGLSLYMSQAIISPIVKIKHIINDLGKGIAKKVDYKVNNDEIGDMMRSVNNLSEKLQSTATFATEIGAGNFNTHFEPLGPDDTLGMALVSMRNNIKDSSSKLNEAQQLAHVGSWERIIQTEKLYLSEEMFNIFEIDSRSFDYSYKSLIKFLHPDDLKYVEFINRKNLYESPVPFECRIITPTRMVKTIYVETKILFNKAGEPEKTFGIVQDITKRKADEAFIRQSEASLEIKNKELLAKNKELEQFAYVASHDLQEPLRTTVSFVDLLQRQYKGKIDSKADKYLTYLSKASERMQQLINGLLDYSLIGSKNKFQTVNCNVLSHELRCDLKPLIEKNNAVLVFDELPLLEGHPCEIKQLFHHLVVNSIKFRKKEVTPMIQVGATDRGVYWEFFIRDNGIGIDEEHKERVFVIFQRLHTLSEYDGAGIGLSHCRKIVELHGGKIWLESTPGSGTTFYFTLRKKQAEATANHAQSLSKSIQ